MDIEEFRNIIERSNGSVFELIELAIKLASSEYPDEFHHRRAEIVEKLFAPPPCPNCSSPITPQSNHHHHHHHHHRHRDEDELEGETDKEKDPFRGIFEDEEEEDDEDEEVRVLRIKDRLEDPHQTEDSLVELLQTLADMDITFKALKETDIGRHVNRLRKHSSNDVRVLVKQLVRKWKELVDEWVKVNTPEEHTASTLIGDGDSPQQPRKNTQNGHHQVPDFAYSPSSHNGNSMELEPKPKTVPRRDSAVKPPHSASASASAPPKFQRQQKDSSIDQDRLDSASKRLQENYQDAQNARKQRKIQVMDIHEIPKPKNGFIARNKGGPHGRHR